MRPSPASLEQRLLAVALGGRRTRRAARSAPSRRACRAAGRRRASTTRRRRSARCRARRSARPSVSVASAFICQFASGSNSAVGSFERPDRLITPSTPSSALVRDVAHVGHDELDLVAERAQRLLAEVEPVEHAHPVAALEQPSARARSRCSPRRRRRGRGRRLAGESAPVHWSSPRGPQGRFRLCRACRWRDVGPRRPVCLCR